MSLYAIKWNKSRSGQKRSSNEQVLCLCKNVYFSNLIKTTTKLQFRFEFVTFRKIKNMFIFCLLISLISSFESHISIVSIQHQDGPWGQRSWLRSGLLMPLPSHVSQQVVDAYLRSLRAVTLYSHCCWVIWEQSRRSATSRVRLSFRRIFGGVSLRCITRLCGWVV